MDTFVLPGLNGSGDSHWQAHWTRDNTNARIIEQRDWNCPHLAEWQERLDEELASQDNIWIVAHSLGTLLAANLAERPSAKKIRGALLVAPCDLAKVEELHPCVVNFGGMPVRRLPFPSMVVASRNDPYMSLESARQFANLWGSELADIGNAGHINIRSGHGRWPLGYELLNRLKAREVELRQARSRRLSVVEPWAGYSSMS
ncbi:alpha/beta hydrolase [Rhizobium sp. CG5]|uniref:RBBP9/YdeN family alpha/beta hydrolase n=1 Tax=Rhizobium sp. CG5 TaxID=2726076 RepID=UPI002034188A